MTPSSPTNQVLPKKPSSFESLAFHPNSHLCRSPNTIKTSPAPSHTVLSLLVDWLGFIPYVEHRVGCFNAQSPAAAISLGELEADRDGISQAMAVI